MSYSLFVDLTESKLIPSYWHVSAFTAEQIGNVAYMYFMGLYILSTDPMTSKWASSYAHRTNSLGDFTQQINTANDLYVAVFALRGGVGFKDKIASGRYLSGLRIDWRKLKSFLHDLAAGLPRNMRSFLLNLDAGLNIKDATLKSIRRQVMDWETLDASTKHLVVTRMLSELNRIAPKAELVSVIQQLARTPSNASSVNTNLTGLFKGLR
jgi:hypothetical protein